MSHAVTHAVTCHMLQYSLSSCDMYASMHERVSRHGRILMLPSTCHPIAVLVATLIVVVARETRVRMVREVGMEPDGEAEESGRQAGLVEPCCVS
jgi:hypothetical protein